MDVPNQLHQLQFYYPIHNPLPGESPENQSGEPASLDRMLDLLICPYGKQDTTINRFIRRVDLKNSFPNNFPDKEYWEINLTNNELGTLSFVTYDLFHKYTSLPVPKVVSVTDSISPEVLFFIYGNPSDYALVNSDLTLALAHAEGGWTTREIVLKT